jgi:predicted nuclease of restriction endonuclease-like (RecB) superfamily
MAKAQKEITPTINGINAIVEGIKDIVEKARERTVSLVNIEMLLTYWQIGKLIATKGKQYQSDREFILELSKKLTTDLGKGFSRSNLFTMLNFFLAYKDVQTLSGQLNWSHYCELLQVSDKQARLFYEKETQNSNWSVRELKRQIDSSLFERLLLSKGKGNKVKLLELAEKGIVLNHPTDILKEPYVFEFLGIPEKKPILERDLERKLIKNIEDFLLELGKGFMFVGSQQRVTIGNRHHYVDMVFYNKILKAYVLIDLKIRKLKLSDAGNMNGYLNYYKIEVNDEADNAPIGIILCADKDEITAEYALGGLSNQVFASKYIYHLPKKELLIKQVEKVIEEKK